MVINAQICHIGLKWLKNSHITSLLELALVYQAFRYSLVVAIFTNFLFPRFYPFPNYHLCTPSSFLPALGVSPSRHGFTSQQDIFPLVLFFFPFTLILNDFYLVLLTQLLAS